MNRNASYDYVRLIASFSIVLFHSGNPAHRWAEWGLPFFLLLLGAFAVPVAARVSMADYARSRAQRLLRPWLAWSVVYTALLALEATLQGRSFLSTLYASMLLTGPSLHLWFLPFAFGAGCVIHVLAQALSPRTLGWVGAALALAALGATQAISWPIPLVQWLFAVPPLGLGILLSTETPSRQIVGTGLVLGSTVALGWWSVSFLPLVIGLAAFVLCRAVCLPETPRSRALTDVALTVYLAHPLVQKLLLLTMGLRLDTYTSVVLVIAITTAGAFAARMAVTAHLLPVASR